MLSAEWGHGLPVAVAQDLAGIAHAAKLIDGLRCNDGILIFTDLIGATPSNIAHNFLDDPKVRIVTGVNLPAIITALSAPKDAPVNQVMTLAEGAAHAGISSRIGRVPEGTEA